MGISCFDLQKNADDYLIRVTDGESRRKVGFGRRLVKRIAQMVWRFPDPDEKPSQNLSYTPSDICNLDTQADSQRGKATTMPDAHKLSQVLRVIGDYLDRKEARTFSISMSTHSMLVRYRTSGGYQITESFTVANLYDRAVHMYLRRSSREGPHG